MNSTELDSVEVERLEGRIRQLETMVNEMRVMKEKCDQEIRRLNLKISDCRDKLQTG